MADKDIVGQQGQVNQSKPYSLTPFNYQVSEVKKSLEMMISK